MPKIPAWTGFVAAWIYAGALAEEAPAADGAEPGAEPAETLTDVLPTTAYLSDWLLDDGDVVQVGAYSTNRVTAFDVDFRGGSAIERLGRYRSLSLVTFAELRGTRLFLGVNEDGLLGLHLNAARKNEDERTAELWRMPYLAAPEPAEESEPPTATPRSSR
jgi:hypothetical protein